MKLKELAFTLKKTGFWIAVIALAALGTSLNFAIAEEVTYKAAPKDFGGCDYSSNRICKEYFDCEASSGSGTSAACKDKFKADQRASFCSYIKANDTACMATWPIAAGYSLAAVACGIGCFVPAYGSWAIPICNALTPAVQVADFAVAIGINTANEDYLKKADKGVVSDFWGSTGEGRDFLSYALPNIAAAIQGGTIIGGYVGSATAAASKGAGQAGTQGTNVAGKAADASKSASRTAKNDAACVSMALNGLMAGLKWANFVLIQDNSEENYNKVCSMHATTCDFTKKQESIETPTAGVASLGAGGTPPTVADNRDHTPYIPVRIKDRVNKEPGKVSDSFATAELKKTFGTPPGAMQKTIDDLYKNLGASPGDLAESVANNGLAGTLEKLGAGPEAKDLLKKIDAQGRQYLQSNPMSFASAGSGGGRSSGGGAANPFGGLFGNRGPAAETGKVNELKFGGFNGDIWHAGTNLSIFEIVSQRTQSVYNRVGQ